MMEAWAGSIFFLRALMRRSRLPLRKQASRIVRSKLLLSTNLSPIGLTCSMAAETLLIHSRRQSKTQRLLSGVCRRLQQAFAFIAAARQARYIRYSVGR